MFNPHWYQQLTICERITMHPRALARKRGSSKSHEQPNAGKNRRRHLLRQREGRFPPSRYLFRPTFPRIPWSQSHTTRKRRRDECLCNLKWFEICGRISA
uniref:Uncharacterized protein n=1 Tax=Arundo donax TaxID=35708 RepID=A0A0A9GS47_ARUDO